MKTLLLIVPSVAFVAYVAYTFVMPLLNSLISFAYQLGSL
jgi:hypothetical protein